MTVLGFSLTGGVIPVGDGPLLYLDTSFDCAEGLFGLEDVIISNSSGESMSVTIAELLNIHRAAKMSQLQTMEKKVIVFIIYFMIYQLMQQARLI